MSSISQAGVQRVPTDSGTAIPVGGTLNIVGAGGIVTSAVGDTVTITSGGGGGFVETLTPDVGGPISPSANNINILGGAGIITSGSGSSITIATTGVTMITYTPVSSSPYVVLLTDDFLGVDSSGGAIQINLPNAPSTGRVWIIKDSTGSAAIHNITVTTVGGIKLIDGSATYVMNTAYEAINVLYDGTNYQIF